LNILFTYIKIVLIICIVALHGDSTFAGSTNFEIVLTEDRSIAQQSQEFNLSQFLYSHFEPDPLVVQKDIPLKIYATTDRREHVNRLSILPWITSSDLLAPGKATLIEFTPDQTGEFTIRNIGHGFTGVLEVVGLDDTLPTDSISSPTESQQITTDSITVTSSALDKSNDRSTSGFKTGIVGVAVVTAMVVYRRKRYG